MKEWQDKITEVFDELKDFQRATVDYAYDRLNENKRYLVADEVGLGKTKIAKGIIAKTLQNFINKKSKKPYRVFYICSNQALADQNLKDLNIFQDNKFVDRELSRLIYLAKKRDSGLQFSLSSLTPSTSFKITSGPGHQDERKLIYAVLTLTEEFKKTNLQRGLKWLLIGDVESWENWQERLTWYQKQYSNDIIQGIPQKFVAKLKKVRLKNDFDDCLKEIEFDAIRPQSLFDLVNLYAEKLAHKHELKRVNKDYKHRHKLLVHLRKILIDISLDNLDADLFILDEFQKFKELLGVGQYTEASRLAQKVFSIKGAKCLMLSATPFKLYTTRFDELENENHYEELLQLLKFLYNGDSNKISDFEKHRVSYFSLLKNIKSYNSESLDTKVKLEGIYKKVLCRTEKLLVSDNKDSMVMSRDIPDLVTLKIDLDNFIHTDRTFQTLINKFQKKINYSIDYNKSVPFPLSFMDGYKSKLKFKEFINERYSESRSLIKEHKNAWLDLDQIQNYKLSKIPNTKYRGLVDESIEKDELWKLLWLPPTVPYYSGMGVFKDKTNLSKILIFSRWVMVPKMIAGLISYEVERKTIGNSDYFPGLNAKYSIKAKANNKGDDAEDSEFGKRKPLPILRLQRKNNFAASMRSFTLLYPSKTLSELFDITSNIKENISYKELRNEYVKIIEGKLESLKNYGNPNSPNDKNWYWAAPILLDKTFNFKYYQNWIEKLHKHPITTRKEKKGDKVNLAAVSHLEEVINIFKKNSTFLPLGAMPNDLEKVLTDIALGSPANCLFKSFRKYFKKDQEFNELMDLTLGLAYDFMLFFDKPESIASVQINEALKYKRIKDFRDNIDIQWNLVLRYCIDGNLQSVLDEYCHMLYSKNRNIKSLSAAIAAGLYLRTSSVKVEGLANSRSTELKTKSLRCHYAVSFGNQNLETEEGVSRASDVINNFNSPFRPFVLASTSLGQEGLDFHYYCRKIMHWNLPYNPVEFEQREGRINRFKGLVIRQNIGDKYKSQLLNFTDIWEELFQIAEQIECKIPEKPQIIPFWHTESKEGLKIERIVPLFPFSKDVSIYRELISVLALYRLTFGQPRQEDLIKIFKNSEIDKQDLTDIYEKFLLNLSPIMFKQI